MNESTNSSSNQLLVPGAIILAGIIVAGAVYMSRGNTTVPTPQGGQVVEQDIALDPITSDDHILGNPSAELVVVEYSDTECPFCKVFHQTMQRIMDEYGKDGEVAWVYRHFPIEQLHQKAKKEAEATECASEIGGKSKFWDYIDMVFERTRSNDSLDPAELPKIAKDIGLDQVAFNSCLESGRHVATVQEDYDSGIRAGVQGTPFSVILTKDGKTFPIEGALPYEAVKGLIESLLKGN